MTQAHPAESRVREIGREIFELADAGKASPWHKSWWLDHMTHLMDGDVQLRTRAFQFVDCLPTLRTNGDIARHVAEFFNAEQVNLPRWVGELISSKSLGSLRASVMGRFARFSATQMAGRFITGYDIPSAIKTIRRLRNQKMGFTLDVLGESTTSNAQADRYAGVYHDLIERLVPIVGKWSPVAMIDRDASGPMPRANFSIKLTGLDPHFDAIDPERSVRVVSERLRPLLRSAQRVGAFVNIDVESYKHRDLAVAVFKHVLMEDEFRDWCDVGIVVQAYLKDAEDCLSGLLAWGRQRASRFAIRLVKGAYWDAETAAAVRHYTAPPVWINKWESDACYERATVTMLASTDLIRPAFASHNVRSLAYVMAAAERLGVSTRGYELQMLFGMGDALKTALASCGQCVRIYCPYGDLMPGMGYLIRRLLENTSNEGFLSQTYNDRGQHDRLLANPATHRRPSGPLPRRDYRDTDPEEPMSSFQNATNTNFAKSDNREKLLGALEYVSGESGRNHPLIIGGQNVTTSDWFASVNPSRSTEVIGRIAQATRTEVDRAIGCARDAFTIWRNTPVAERANLLRRVAERIETRRFELAATIILEVGKPWREADADVTEAVDHWRYYADQIERIESRPRIRNIPGENNMLSYTPKGVCAVLSPWSFPLAILSGMTSAALAGGNTVVIKPARQSAVTAGKLVGIAHDVGIPPGVINFLPGDGATIGGYLVEHGDVNVVAFTGSCEVGAEVIRSGAVVRPDQSFIKKMIVEMGGKNAIIVDDDADLDGAVSAIVESAFSYAGQKCSSCSRLIVLDGVYDQLLSRLREAAASVPIGPADQPSTLVGPLIDESARARVRAFMEAGKREGRLLIEGKLPDGCDRGFFVPPAIFVDLKPDARLFQEEIFGPILAVARAVDFDEAITMANQSRYALTGGVFSRSPANIEQARRDFAVGNLYINRRITSSQVDAQPFGGFKLSGTGVKAGSPDYLLHFMDARCITEHTARSGFVPNEQTTEVS